MSNILSALKVLIGADSTELNQKLAESQERVTQWGEKIGSVMEGITFAGIGFSVAAAADKFEEASARIQRATGATGEKLEGLEQSFEDVYKQTAASSDSVAQVLSLLSTRSQATGEDLDNLALKTLKLAKTQKEDVTALVPSITAMFGAWHIATSDQGAAMDYLRVVSQQTGTPVVALTTTLREQAPILQALGFDWQKAAALIGNFEKEGVNTGAVLAGMKGVLKSFAKEGVEDTAASWAKLTAGVKDGSVTFDQFIKIAGARGGTYLFEAIRDGATDVSALTDKYRALAKDGGASMQTMHEKLVIWGHDIEALIGKHYELIAVLNTAIPAVVSLSGVFGTIGSKVLPILANITTAIQFGLVGALSAFEMALLASGLLAVAGIAYVAGGALYNATHQQAPTAYSRKTHQPIGNTSEYQHNAENAGTPPKMPWDDGLGGGDAKENLKKDFSELGIKDLATDLANATKAFNELTAAGKLNAGQIEEAKEHISKLRGELELLRQGITPDMAKEMTQGPMQGPPVQMATLVQNANTLKGSYEDIVKLLQSWSAETEKVALPTSLGPEVTDLVAEYERLQSDVRITSEAFQAFGVQTQSALDKAVADATQNYQILRDSGEASYKDLAIAALKLAQVQADAAVHSGAITQQAWKETSDKIKQDLNELDGAATKEQSQISKDMGRAADSMFNSIEGDLAKDIVQWKGWQKSITQICQTLAEDVLKLMMKALLKPLEDQVSSAFQQLGGMLGGVLGGSKPGSGGILGTGSTGIVGAITANTAAHTANTAATTTNTAGTVTNTAAVATNTGATIADTTATGVNAGAQIAALTANTVGTATSTVTFATADTANTAAVVANTAMLGVSAAGEEGGGFLSGMLSIFGFAGGGDAPRSRSGASMVKIHDQEMVLPPNVANGFRSLFAGGKGFPFGSPQLAIPAGAGSAAGDQYSFAQCSFGAGLTQAAVSQIFQQGIRQAKLAGAFKST